MLYVSKWHKTWTDLLHCILQAAKKSKQNDAMHFTAGAVPVPVALESEFTGELPAEVFSKV